MIPPNLGDQLQVFTLIAAATITANGNGSGVDLQAYEGEVALVLNSAHGSGNADNTLVVKIQDSADNSSFADVAGAAFAAVDGTTDSVQKMSLNKNELRRYIRAVKTVGGTSPSYVAGCVGVGMKKYADGA